MPAASISKTMSEEQQRTFIGGLAKALSFPHRSPILKTPADVGLAFQEMSFLSSDGVSLEAWFIPREGSDKLVIANHPMGFSRYGFPSHLEPWKSLYASFGNDIEVNFIPDYKILHDAGYNVLTYDLRNFGHSGAANGGVNSGGLFEARDVIGSLMHARTHKDLSSMRVALFSRCLGCNATLFAMEQQPEQFREVRCMVALQPLSTRVAVERMLELAGAPADAIEDLEQQMRLNTSFALDDHTPVHAAKSVMVPTLMGQVHDDLMTRPSDVQSIFDNVPVQEKELFWINGTTRRWDGYNYFQKNPQQMLGWFDEHMK